MKAEVLELTLPSARASQWESLVCGCEAGGFMQSLHWARFKEAQRLNTFHVGLVQQDRLIGGCLFYSARNARNRGFLIAPEGPILPWDNTDLAAEGLQLILDEAGKYATKCGAL